MLVDNRRVSRLLPLGMTMRMLYTFHFASTATSTKVHYLPRRGSCPLLGHFDRRNRLSFTAGRYNILRENGKVPKSSRVDNARI